MIHGHTPIDLCEVRELINSRFETGRINLDNGCVYKQYDLKAEKDLGRLCALDLDKMKLIFKENID